jgi:glyoxylase-like metal-dependent hydrolase (beta-lactamase superfamily II)
MNAGYCSQFAFWTGLKSWRWSKFFAVVVYFEHPKHGKFLIDTGYGDSFWSATSRWPFRLYRWTVPASISSQNCLTASLDNQGIDLASIDGVFLSHFHPDHMAGVASLPGKALVLRHEPLKELFQLSSMRQLKLGFVPQLFPQNRLGDIQGISESCFQLGRLPGTDADEFRVFDYWGDGSLVLVDLPGHAPGHTGYLLNSSAGPMFYVVDATWSMDVLLQQRQLPRCSRGLQADYQQYWQTQKGLSKLASNSAIPFIACHCPRTQAYVAD